MKNFIKVIILLIGISSYSQTTVKGVVTDEKNNPLPQVNVLIVGSNAATSTDVDGKFSWPPKGKKGFGYDPIFRPLDHKLTFAEMVPNFKHNISHRSIAFNKLIKMSFPTLSS